MCLAQDWATDKVGDKQLRCYFGEDYSAEGKLGKMQEKQLWEVLVARKEQPAMKRNGMGSGHEEDNKKITSADYTYDEIILSEKPLNLYDSIAKLQC